MHRNCVCLRPPHSLYASTLPPSPVKWRSIHSGAKCTAFIHLMPTFIVSKSFSASYQFASEPKAPVPVPVPAGPPPGSGAGNKRVSIVSVRLSLIMKTAATLSLENASAITHASQSCHPPRSLLERDSLINATSLILETQSLLVLPPFVALSQRQLKFVAIGYGRRRRRRRRREQGGI